MADDSEFQLSTERLDLTRGSAGAAALLAYWRGKCAGRRFPARADVDPMELRRFIGDISLLDVRRDPFDFIFRLAGTRLAGDAGYDLTGRSVRAIRPAAWANAVLAQLREVAETGVPMLHRFALTIAGETMCYDRMTLPLGQDDTVTMLLTYSDRPAGFRDFMAQLAR